MQARNELRRIVPDCRLPVPVPIPVPIPRRKPGPLSAIALGVTLAVAVSTSAATSAHAHYAVEAADGRLVDVSIKVRGHSAPLFVRQGDWNRYYLEAFEGRNYSLVLRNTTGRRVAVLISVDGLNVVNGERSALRNTEPMYVLGPWEQAEIQGWRTSLESIRRFVFVDEKRSYAERTGQANGDMGWVRVLAFQEDVPWWQNPRIRIDGEGDYRSERQNEGRAGERESRQSVPEPQGPGAPESNQGRDDLGAQKRRAGDAHGSQEGFPGTGWGENRYDPVRQTEFRPRPQATDHLVFRYEYASGLRALGIDTRRQGDRLWERDGGYLGFAKPPRW
jgi:hypothetical protein